MIRHPLKWFVVWSIVACVPRLVWSDPNHLKQDAPLNIHGLLPEAKEIYPQAVEAHRNLKEMLERINAGNLPPKEFGAFHLASTRLERLAPRLVLLGEPAGAELNLLFSSPTRWNEEYSKFMGTPQGQRVYAQIMQKLKSKQSVSARQKAVQQLEKLIQSGNFIAAEKLLDETYDGLRPDTAYLGTSDRAFVYDMFKTVDAIISTRMREFRVQQANAAKQEVIVAAFKERDALLAASGAAAQQLSARGTVDVGGKPLPGPAAMAEFARLWGSVHVSLMHAAAIDYAIQGGDMEQSYGRADDKLWGKWTNEMMQLAAAVQKNFAAMIDAEAKAAPPQIARARYVEYLQVLGGLVGRVANTGWSSAFQVPLQQLADKGQLRASVDAYDQATSEVLRWRERVAVAQLATQEKEYPRLKAEFDKKVVNRDQFIGLAINPHPVPVFIHSLFKGMPNICEQLNKTKGVAPKVFRFDGPNGLNMCRYENGVYVRLPSNLRPATGPQGLVQDLMVDAQHPPLTLTTAAAISSLERGEYEWVGGEVVGVEVAGSVSRFAILPPIAAALVPYDAVQPAVSESSNLQAAVVQLALQPAWLCHRYFFSKVSTEPSATNAPPAAAPSAAPPAATSAPPAATPAAPAPSDAPAPPSVPSAPPSVPSTPPSAPPSAPSAPPSVPSTSPALPPSTGPAAPPSAGAFSTTFDRRLAGAEAWSNLVGGCLPC